MCKAITELILDGKVEGKAEVVKIFRNMNVRKMKLEDIAALTEQPREYIGSILGLIWRYPQKDDLEIARILIEREAVTGV